MAKNFGPGDSWLRGVVARQLGPVTYLVNLTGGRLWKRHLDHLKELSTPPDPPDDTDYDTSLPPVQDETVTPPTSDGRSDKTSDSSSSDPIDPQGASPSEPSEPPSDEGTAIPPPSTDTPRYPTGQRCPPTRYDPSN